MIATDCLWNLKNEIFDICYERGMWVDIRWKCFGDRNKFYINNEDYVISCVNYFASDLDDVKDLLLMYIENMWEDIEPPHNRVAMYIEDIVDMDGWYQVIMGGCLFRDEAGD